MEQKKPAWRLAGSMLLTHIGAAVLCFVIMISLSIIWDNQVYHFFLGLFILFIYWMVMSGSAWQEGNRDLNRVHFKRMEPDLSRGFRLGLLASIPLFILAAAVLGFKIAEIAGAAITDTVSIAVMAVYRMLNPHIMLLMNLILDTGTLKSVDLWQVILVCLMSFVTPLCTASGYLLGYKDIVLMDRMVYKNQKKK